MATHTDKGIPIITEEITRKIMREPLQDTEAFRKKIEEFILRMEEENPELAHMISAQIQIVHLVSKSEGLTEFILHSFCQLIMLFEESEEQYRKEHDTVEQNV